MAVTPKGVRMINDNVVQDGLGLVFNKRDVMDWNHIPNGSLYINPDTGIMMTKVAGETDWIPAGIKNDGTLVISRDTSLHVEVFKIISIDNNTHKFVYEDALGRRQTKTKDENGFVFQLDGSYMPGRNHLMVTFDDVLDRSAASGGIEELDEHRFRVKEDIPVGTEVTAKYIQWVRIGNPYPRWYEAYDDPASAEVGDFFLDLDDTVEGMYGDITPSDETPETGNISWARIVGTPTRLAGYGITDAALKTHTHSVSDISGLANYVDTRVDNSIDSKIQTLTSKLTGGTIKVKKAETADTATRATSADTATRATSAGSADTATSATSAQKIVVSNRTFEVDSAQAAGTGGKNKIAVYDASGHIPEAALPTTIKNNVFVVGMIIDWYGSSNAAPAGWAICDGRSVTVNGQTIITPNLSGKFVISGATSGTYKASTHDSNWTATLTTGGASTVALTTAQLPAHDHPHTHQHSHGRGTMNITGTISASTEKYKGNITGAFYEISNYATVGDHRYTVYGVGFDASRSWTGATSVDKTANSASSVGSGQAHNNMPPYVALFKIMYVGV